MHELAFHGLVNVLTILFDPRLKEADEGQTPQRTYNRWEMYQVPRQRVIQQKYTQLKLSSRDLYTYYRQC